jgi:hypothetical protein
VPKNKKMEKVPSNTSIAILESRYFPSKRIDGPAVLPYATCTYSIHTITHTSYYSELIGCRHRSLPNREARYFQLERGWRCYS